MNKQKIFTIEDIKNIFMEGVKIGNEYRRESLHKYPHAVEGLWSKFKDENPNVLTENKK